MKAWKAFLLAILAVAAVVAICGAVLIHRFPRDHRAFRAGESVGANRA